MPARRLAVLTCMDCRIDPVPALGLAPGDAVILRNAGAEVSDDVLRSLRLAQPEPGGERGARGRAHGLRGARQRRRGRDGGGGARGRPDRRRAARAARSAGAMLDLRSGAVVSA